MLRSLLALSVSLAFVVLAVPCPAQGVAAGRSSKGAANPPGDAKNKGFDVKGPDVVKQAPKARPVLKWLVQKEGPSYGTDNNYFLGIDTIVLYSDGRMRVTYFLHNKGNKNHGTNIIGTKLFVSGPDGETYRPLDMQFRPNNEGQFKVLVQGGAKERFWAEFPAPSEETEVLRFNVPVDDFLMSGIPFNPFTVKLDAPISAGMANPKEAAPVVLPVEPAKPAVTPVPEMVVVTPPKPPTGQGEPKNRAALLRALREIPGKGQRYEGNIRPKAGDPLDGGILFDVKTGEGAITARLYRKPGSPKGVKVMGEIKEDVTVGDGLAIELTDLNEIIYTFVLEGNMLRGHDSAGNHYAFHLIK